MMCVLIPYISKGTYSLNSMPNYRFLRNFFGNFIYTLKVFYQKFFSYFLFDVWPKVWSEVSSLITQHTTYHGAFIDHYQPISQDYNLAPHTTHVVLLCIDYCGLQYIFLRNFLLRILFYSQSFWQKTAAGRRLKQKLFFRNSYHFVQDVCAWICTKDPRLIKEHTTRLSQ